MNFSLKNYTFIFSEACNIIFSQKLSVSIFTCVFFQLNENISHTRKWALPSLLSPVKPPVFSVCFPQRSFQRLFLAGCSNRCSSNDIQISSSPMSMQLHWTQSQYYLQEKSLAKSLELKRWIRTLNTKSLQTSLQSLRSQKSMNPLISLES